MHIFAIHAMKLSRILQALAVLCAAAFFTSVFVRAQDLPALIEEDESFWNDFLSQADINNKNLLHASHIAYRERMFDLSIESLKECMKRNEKNTAVQSIATYYIGKNFFQLGNYGDAIRLFAEARDMELGRFSYLGNAITINMAITYLRLGNAQQYHRLLQSVIEADKEGKYAPIAKELLRK